MRNSNKIYINNSMSKLLALGLVSCLALSCGLKESKINNTSNQRYDYANLKVGTTVNIGASKNDMVVSFDYSSLKINANKAELVVLYKDVNGTTLNRNHVYPNELNMGEEIWILQSEGKKFSEIEKITPLTHNIELDTGYEIDFKEITTTDLILTYYVQGNYANRSKNDEYNVYYFSGNIAGNGELILKGYKTIKFGNVVEEAGTILEEKDKVNAKPVV